MIRDSQGLAKALGLPHPQRQALNISRVLFDSRQFNGDMEQVFFALKGPNHDGHHFVETLYQKGIRVFVLMEMPATRHEDAIYFQVEDSFLAIQDIGRQIRQSIKPNLVAVTGSNGKTIVKEWLYRLVSRDFKAYRSPKSFNSQLGVPLSLWSMPDDTELGIFEAGISEPGEMAVLASMLQPNVGVFTNIGSAHDVNFQSREQKVSEKLQLFKSVDYLVASADDSFLIKEIRAFCAQENIQLIDWSVGASEAVAHIDITSQSSVHCRFILKYKAMSLEAEIPFGDEASLQNAVNALCTALHLGVKPHHLQKALAELPAIEMRLEMKEGHQNTLLINDAYNSDFESLRIALHFLQEHGRDRSKVLILSDLLQSGYQDDDLRQQVETVLADAQLERLIVIGPVLSKGPLHFNFPVHYYQTTEEFIYDRLQFDWEHRAILLKGSRPFQFERIDRYFARQRHETVLEVHLNRLVHNLNFYRSRLAENTRLMVMVKAFAYGSGSDEIARVLAFHGVDYLAVAYADEGVALRRAGIQLPIMVLNPESAALDSFFDYNLEPEIYSLKRLQEFQQLAEERDMNLAIHIKLETGMNRLGFTNADLEGLQTALKAQSHLRVASVFSHLAASDDPQEAAFTQAQISRFKQMSEKLAARLNYPFLRHLANTGAIEAYPEAYFDMVRLGIGLYGVAPHPEEQEKLLPVAELKATISQVKDLQAGDTVGYGRAWQAKEASRIAVVSIGYADGFSRALGEGRGKLLIKGKRYPVVGRVCMDMCMVSVGNDPIEEGDEVLIFGTELPVQEVAKAMNTIAYEVLTSISPRVKRVYYMA